MHFHLPKPLHGWREFAGEVGIIVVGVLIALAAEQVVEELHWRRTIAAERKALDADVSEMWQAMSARVVIQHCIDQRLNELGLVFARHERGESLGLIGPIGRPSVWTGDQSAIQMASADGSLSHMSLKDKAAYFGVVASYDTWEPVANEERASWRTFELLDDAPVLDKEDWRELRRAYRNALDNNRTMEGGLRANTGADWLTPFKHFPPLPPNNGAFTVAAVQDLCRPAVKR